eukprot:377492_1
MKIHLVTMSRSHTFRMYPVCAPSMRIPRLPFRSLSSHSSRFQAAKASLEDLRDDSSSSALSMASASARSVRSAIQAAPSPKRLTAGDASTAAGVKVEEAERALAELAARAGGA